MEMAAKADDKKFAAYDGKKKKKKPDHYLLNMDKDESPNRRDDGRVAEPWRCFRAEEADTIGPVYWKDPEEAHHHLQSRRFPYHHRLSMSSFLNDDGPPGSLLAIVGPKNEYLNKYRYQERLEFNKVSLFSSSSGASPYAWPTGPSIFEHSAREIEQELTSLSSSFSPETEAAAASTSAGGAGKGVDKGAHWNIPEIALVHVGSESAARWYCEGRHAFWRYFVAFQRAFARDKPFRPVTLGMTGDEDEDVPPLPPVPYFQMKWKVKPKYWGAIFREVDGMPAE